MAPDSHKLGSLIVACGMAACAPAPTYGADVHHTISAACARGLGDAFGFEWEAFAEPVAAFDGVDTLGQGILAGLFVIVAADLGTVREATIESPTESDPGALEFSLTLAFEETGCSAADASVAIDNLRVTMMYARE